MSFWGTLHGSFGGMNPFIPPWVLCCSVYWFEGREWGFWGGGSEPSPPARGWRAL